MTENQQQPDTEPTEPQGDAQELRQELIEGADDLKAKLSEDDSNTDSKTDPGRPAEPVEQTFENAGPRPDQGPVAPTEEPASTPEEPQEPDTGDNPPDVPSTTQGAM